MKLWLLKPVDERPEGDDPWRPWYDKAFGFVVRARDEESARKFAHESAGDENRGEFLGKKVAATTTPWLDPRYSTCEELKQRGEEGVILCDVAEA